MKRLITLVLSIFVLAATLVANSNAATPKSLVIIDSGISKELPWVNEILLDEACFIEYGRCPNGQSSMTGLGAAAIPSAQIKDKALHHGTQMASIAYQVNPGVRIVAIRIVGMSAKGFANSYTTRAVTTALTWVNANATRLNVGAVSLSIGRSYKEAACPIETPLLQEIQKLNDQGIAVVASAGNGSNKLKIDYPACIPQVIAIGATDSRYTVRNVQGWVHPIMLISNTSSDLDYYTLGRYTTTNAFGEKAVSIGTSAATVAFATDFVQKLNRGLSYQEVINEVNNSLTNAHRTATDFVRLQHNVEAVRS